MEEQTLQELIEADMKLECSLVVIRTQDLPYIREELQRIARYLKHDICFWNYRKQFHNILSGSGVEVQLSDFLYDSLMDEEALQEVGRAIQAESRGFSQKEEEFPLTRESCVGELRDTEDYDVVFSWFTNASFQNPTILVVESSRLLFSSSDECRELSQSPSSGKTLIVLDDDIEETTVAHALAEYAAYHEVATVEKRGIVGIYSKICERYGVEIPTKEVQERIAGVLSGLTMDQARMLLTDVVRKNDGKLGENEIPALFKERFTKKFSKTLIYRDVEKDVALGGYDKLLEWLEKRRDLSSEEAREFGISMRGILLVGAPGCGKSHAAKIIAKIFNRPLIEFRLAECVEVYVGQSEALLRETLNQIDMIGKNGGIVLLIDELEKVIRKRTENSQETIVRMQNMLLTWLSEREANSVFIVGACNNLNETIPELTRAGRWDETFYMSLPNQRGREEIFKIHVNKRKHTLTSKEIHELACLTDGYSGAEIEQVVKDGLLPAFERDRTLRFCDIQQAIRETTPLSKRRPLEIAAYSNEGCRTGISASSADDEQNKQELIADPMYA